LLFQSDAVGRACPQFFDKEGTMTAPLIELGRTTICQSGCYSKVEVYYLGWIHGLANSKFVYGLQGKETCVTVERIKPAVSFYVYDAKGAAA
jgi:hypothetical protein